ncbi:STAS domain-containing protein [Streptomyces sp. NPDC017941]|uniref:STAS domain-containing protein n=1 Tax=Streptomyces sp. NPDC017941 TaxID=3365018 RepID=UPI0037A48A51
MYEVGDATVIELCGEVDLVALQQTTPLIDTVTAGPARTVVLDLSRTTFIDCSGLALLMRARCRLDARDARLGVVCTDRMSLRVMGITGLKATLSPVASVREALAHAQPDP